MLDEKKLIEYEYFPMELPNCFSTSDILKHYSEIKGQLNATNYNTSKPLLFSIYKNEKARRRMALPNLYHYMKSIQILCENESELERIYNLSKYSLTKPSKNQKNTERRAFNRESNTPKDTRSRNENLYLDNTVCIKMDISNFFDSIYTHSIAWVFHTKSIAKQKKNDNILLGNKIDGCLQGMNDRQTHGLLVGNAVSRLIAELILCKIDEAILRKFPKVEMCRYVDDYSFYIKEGVNQLYSVDEIITFVRNQLLEYDLLLNESKTKILKAPFIFGQNGLDELQSIIVTDAYLYFNRMMFIYNKYQDIALLRYGLKVLRYKLNNENFSLLFPLLINLWVKFPSLADCILPILYDFKSEVKKRTLTNALKTVVLNGLSYRNEIEVVWAIWAMVCFDIQITSKLLQEIITSNNDFAIIQVLAYLKKDNKPFYQTGVLELEKIIIQDATNEITNLDNNDEYILTSRWLLIYEIVVKNITSNETIVNYVKNNQFFNKLLLLKVDFYNPETMVFHKKEQRKKESIRKMLSSITGNSVSEKQIEEMVEIIEKNSGWMY